MNATVFKAVNVDYAGCHGYPLGISPDTYVSAMSYFLPKEYVLTYKIGETTYPKIGRIFVFKSLEDAKAFMYSNCNNVTKILKGIATNIGHPKQIAEYFELDGIMLNFWLNKSRKKKQTACLKKRIPNGTLTCSSFTPTEVAYPDPKVIKKEI